MKRGAVTDYISKLGLACVSYERTCPSAYSKPGCYCRIMRMYDLQFEE